VKYPIKAALSLHNNQRIELYPLTAYGPGLNTIERIWKLTYEHAVKNIRPPAFRLTDTLIPYARLLQGKEHRSK